jgi:hypothetical protein
VLSEREEDTLLEIERRLIADDPDLERSFQALGAVAPAPRGGCPRVSSVIIAVAAVLAAGMLMAGSPAGAVAYTVIAGLVWGVRDLPDTTDQENRDE